MEPRPNFDRIARPYRWLEYFSLGGVLERCRFHFLSKLTGRTRALVLGDGDGRFLARILAQNPLLTADAVDSSAAMLKLLCDRCEAQAPGSKHRLRTHHCDAIDFLARTPATQYDLVVTHFFLDCLSQGQVESLAAGIAARMASDALWLVSDFRIPSGSMRLPARIYVRSLYFAFRLITGLRVTQLPDHISAFSGVGLYLVDCNRTFAGMLTTELWAKIPVGSDQPAFWSDL